MMRREKTLFVAGLCLAAAIALAAGLAVRHFSSAAAPVTLADFAQFEPHWRVLNGPGIALSDLQGKLVLFNFWASWCPPCIEEMPLLDRFSRQYADQISVIGVVVDLEEPAMMFLEQNNIQFPSIIAELHLVDQMLGLFVEADGVLPFTVVFSAAGEIVSSTVGPIAENELRALVGTKT